MSHFEMLLSLLAVAYLAFGFGKFVARSQALEGLVIDAVEQMHPHAYGAGIMRLIEERVGYRYSIGAIYAVLFRLERQGKVVSRPVPSGPERGFRRKLAFTMAGRSIDV